MSPPSGILEKKAQKEKRLIQTVRTWVKEAQNTQHSQDDSCCGFWDEQRPSEPQLQSEENTPSQSHVPGEFPKCDTLGWKLHLKDRSAQWVLVESSQDDIFFLHSHSNWEENPLVPWWPRGWDSALHYRGLSPIPGQETEISQACVVLPEKKKIQER